MAETELELYIVVGFGISNIEPAGCIIRELISSLLVYVVS
jgi:hypothetical protein